MAVKIRLKRLGKIRSPHYRIVVMDSRAKRDGRAIEEIGLYHPKNDPSVIRVNSERAQYWLGVGAQPTEQVLAILKITGDWQKYKGLPGAEGTLRDNRIWSKKLLPGQTGWTTMQTILPDSGAVEHHPFDAEVNHLVDCIRENRESHCNIADAYRTHEVCIAVDRSLAQGGKPVKLPLE